APRPNRDGGSVGERASGGGNGEWDMIERTLERTEILRDLGDGLVLRRARREDAEELAAFNARMHSDDGPDKPDEPLRIWVRELLEQPHPSVSPDDFTVVEDTR